MRMRERLFLTLSEKSNRRLPPLLLCEISYKREIFIEVWLGHEFCIQMINIVLSVKWLTEDDVLTIIF